MVRTLRSPKLQKEYRKRYIWKTVFGVFLLALLVGIPIYLSRLSSIRIQSVTVSGNSVIPSGDIEAVAKEQIQGKFLHVFPKDNIFFYPKSAVVSAIAKTFSRIESFQVERKSFSSIAISIVERKPKSLWCEEYTAVSSCFFLDDNGLIFDRAPSFSDNVYFVYTGNISGDPIGQYFLEPEQFNKLRVFIDGVKNLGLQPVALSTISDNSYQIHDKNSGVIIVSLEDTEKTLSNLESIISDTTLGVLKDGNLQVRSLDLRYGNKIILKKE